MLPIPRILPFQPSGRLPVKDLPDAYVRTGLCPNRQSDDECYLCKKPDYGGDWGVEGQPAQETMARLGKAPLEYQPGTRWNYSLSSDVLGYVIEVVSGMSLEAFFQQRLFTPLGMKDTYFNVPASKHSRLSALNTQDSLGNWHKIPDSSEFPASFSQSNDLLFFRRRRTDLNRPGLWDFSSNASE